MIRIEQHATTQTRIAAKNRIAEACGAALLRPPVVSVAPSTVLAPAATFRAIHAAYVQHNVSQHMGWLFQGVVQMRPKESNP